MAEVYAAVFVPNVPEEYYFSSQMRLGAAWYDWCIWVEDHRDNAWPLMAHTWLPSLFGEQKVTRHRFTVMFVEEEAIEPAPASDDSGNAEGLKSQQAPLIRTCVDEKSGDKIETFVVHANSAMPFEETNRRLSSTCIFVHAINPTTPDGDFVRPAAKVHLGTLSSRMGVSGPGYTLERVLTDPMTIRRDWIGDKIGAPGLQMRWIKEVLFSIRNLWLERNAVQWNDDWIMRRVVGIAGAGSEEAWEEMEYRRNPYAC